MGVPLTRFSPTHQPTPWCSTSDLQVETHLPCESLSHPESLSGLRADFFSLNPMTFQAEIQDPNSLESIC